jgi:hypothetical protein
MLPNIDFKIVAAENAEGKAILRCSSCEADMATRYNICQHCFQNAVKQAQTDWSSKDPKLDRFILKSQQEADSPHQIIEWIPYENFESIEFIAHGGFAKVYKGTWKQGCWECLTNDEEGARYYRRRGAMEVALKEKKDSKTLSEEYLQEVSHDIETLLFLL